MFFLRIILTLLALLCVPANAISYEDPPSPVAQGILSSFDIPIKKFSEKPDGSFTQRLLHGFSGSVRVGVPLDLSQEVLTTGDGFRDRFGNTPTLQATLKYNPVGAWFFSGTYYYYKDSDLQADWNPDFSYVFGYDDWRPYTLSLVYSNYGGNRIRPDREEGEETTEFNEGTISLGWKFPVPKKIAAPFLVSKNGGIGCIVNYHVSPQFFDLDSLQNKAWKQSASLGCKYTIKGNWYLNWTAFYYPRSFQQQPWDPDFTYGFGYFDWRPGTISVQYNNFSGNRFFTRERGEGTGRFIDGEISVSWSWSF